jgi:hypothetical protein
VICGNKKVVRVKPNHFLNRIKWKNKRAINIKEKQNVEASKKTI